MGSIRLICSLFIMISLCYQASAAPAITSAIHAINYLKRYGYVPIDQDESLLNGATFSNYLKKMQRMFGIEATANLSWKGLCDFIGELDSETIRMMNTKRCGTPDVKQSHNLDFFSQRFAYSGNKWPTNDVTYGYKIFSTKYNQDSIRSIIRRAFEMWAQVIPLRFTEVDWQVANIKIQFVRRQHDDETYYGYFDGPGNVLAHAYYPRNGYLCFDDDESFTDADYSGTNLFQVALHEIGHALGLDHSNVTSAVMAPKYAGYIPDYHLQDDDIKEIQKAYGTPVPGNPPAQPPSNPTDPPLAPPDGGICSNPTFDSITSISGKTYLFKGSQYYQIQGATIYGPMPCSELFTSEQTNMDAIFQHPFDMVSYNYFGTDRPIFIFKGDTYWVYTKMFSLYPGYPKKISAGFPGIPSDLSAVAYINQKIYFIKGNLVYSYTLDKGLATGYPRTIQQEWGLPAGMTIDLALQAEDGPGSVSDYFITGDVFYVMYPEWQTKVQSGPGSVKKTILKC